MIIDFTSTTGTTGSTGNGPTFQEYFDKYFNHRVGGGFAGGASLL
jgi:hypothetical protein